MNFKKKRNGIKQERSYAQYQMNRIELAKCLLEGIILQGIVAAVFYRSVLAFFLLFPITIFYYQKRKQELSKLQKEKLQLQFKDAVLAISVALESGYSAENACKEAYYDMKLLHGSDSLIGKELFWINKQISNNVLLENLLEDFGKRSEIEDIRDFAEIFRVAKRSGGDLSYIIKNTAQIIADKIEVKKETETILSAKKYEQKIMNKVPFLIILYIGASSPGFFDPLYHNVIGVFVMSICLVLYFVACYMAYKITDIKI